MAATAGAGVAEVDGEAGAADDASGAAAGRADASVVTRLFTEGAGSAARSPTSSVAGGAKPPFGSGGAKATIAPVSVAGAGCLSNGESVLTATITATAAMSPPRATIPFEANLPSVHRSGDPRYGSSAAAIYTSHPQGINAAAPRPDHGDLSTACLSRPRPGATLRRFRPLAGNSEFVLSAIAAI
jgi:hypothetical protein